MIEQLGIPVFVEHASYEKHPLGRTEWVKVYGVMLDREKEAEDFFKSQSEAIQQFRDLENTGKTVAFFYLRFPAYKKIIENIFGSAPPVPNAAYCGSAKFSVNNFVI